MPTLPEDLLMALTSTKPELPRFSRYKETRFYLDASQMRVNDCHSEVNMERITFIEAKDRSTATQSIHKMARVVNVFPR